MKHRLPRVIVLLVVVAVVASLIVRSNRARAAEDPDAVIGSGTVEATPIGVSAETTGRITSLLVDEGDAVESGQIIAELDRDTLEAELKRTEAVAYSARMYLAEVTRGARPEEIRARHARLRESLAALDGSRRVAAIAREARDRPTELTAAVDRARAEYAASVARREQSAAQLAEARNGARSQEIEQAQASVEAAAAAVSRAEAERARAAAARRGAEAELAQVDAADRERQAATTQTANAEAALKVAQAGLEAAQARRDLANAAARPDQRERLRHEQEAAEAAATFAGQELQRARELYEAGAVPLRQLQSAQSTHDAAAARMSAARAALADLDAGARGEERREAEAAVAQTTAQVRGAEEALANARREEQILRGGSRQQLERATSAVEQAREQESAAIEAVSAARFQAAGAQAALALLQAGTRRERIEQAAAGLAAADAERRGADEAVRNAAQARRDRYAQRQAAESAEQQVATSAARADAARAELDLAMAGATSEMREVARGDLEQAQAAVQRIQAQIAQTVVRAPRGGTISEVVLREGETVSPGSVVVRMYDLGRMWVRVYLPLKVFTRVAVGQEASLTCDAAPDSAFGGRVQAVSDEAEFTPKNTQTVDERVKQVFWVKVELLEPGVLKPGVPVDVVIQAPALP